MKQTDHTTYTVYSKKNCSFCDRAILLLEDLNYEVVVKKIDEDISHFNEMRDKAPMMRTMPVILKDDQVIGGYSDLIDFLKNE
jgi:thioredoxin reductase (NADPH)